MQTVLEVLLSAKTGDILNLVKGLATEQQDNLMKYVYRGMASPDIYSSASLLQWHSAVSSLLWESQQTSFVACTNLCTRIRSLTLSDWDRLSEY